MSVTFDQLHAQLEQLNSNFEQLFDKIAGAPAAPAEPKAPTIIPAEAETPKPMTVTIDDCRAAMIALTDAIGRPEAAAWLYDQFAVKKLADLDDDQYADLVFGATERAQQA